MPLPTATAAALAPLPFRQDEPLHKKTWWRVGGKADGYLDVRDSAQLQKVVRACRATGCPLTVMGNASNCLVSDAGVRGLVVRLAGELAQVRPVPGESRLLEVGGGVKLVAFLRKAPSKGHTGLEMLAGVPGTMGGAVKMNAGTRLGEISDVLHSVGLVLADGSIQVLRRTEMAMGYRDGALPDQAIVAWARVHIGGIDPEESQRLIDEHLAYRAKTQPVDVPTCGSTFRNPEGHTAGRLIDQCGLKGHTVGGARVSPKHANFLENTGNATANDIRRLIGQVQQQVWQTHKVLLVPEVQFLGDWEDWDMEETL